MARGKRGVDLMDGPFRLVSELMGTRRRRRGFLRKRRGPRLQLGGRRRGPMRRLVHGATGIQRTVRVASALAAITSAVLGAAGERRGGQGTHDEGPDRDREHEQDRQHGEA
ncbi:MAG TPA: hypothetical protein VKT18_09625, partial [Acidimicrobiales bacterium]|nr:hypothetical protein [Acidimicrobiales bacterium]